MYARRAASNTWELEWWRERERETPKENRNTIFVNQKWTLMVGCVFLLAQQSIIRCRSRSLFFFFLLLLDNVAFSVSYRKADWWILHFPSHVYKWTVDPFCDCFREKAPNGSLDGETEKVSGVFVQVDDTHGEQARETDKVGGRNKTSALHQGANKRRTHWDLGSFASLPPKKRRREKTKCGTNMKRYPTLTHHYHHLLANSFHPVADIKTLKSRRRFRFITRLQKRWRRSSRVFSNYQLGYRRK